MKRSDKFRFAEKCLYEYKRNLACLEVLRDDLRVAQAGLDVKAQNYQYTFDFSGEVSDPVSARVIKIEQLEERISKLERLTKPISTLINDLDSSDVLNGSRNKDLMQVLRLQYFGKNTHDAILQEMNIAKATYFRMRRELVSVAICYMAL